MAEEFDEIRFEEEPAGQASDEAGQDMPVQDAPAQDAPAAQPAPARNQDVLDMIGTLHARLADLEAAVRACDADLPGFAQKLDRIDDKVYLLETEVGKAASGVATPAPAPAAPQDDDGGMKILTPEAKEKIGEFAGDLKVVAKTGAETLADINDAISDITSPFKAFTKPGRRR